MSRMSTTDYCNVDDVRHSKTHKVCARGMCYLHYDRWNLYGDPLFTKESRNSRGTKEHILENIKEQPAPIGYHYKDLIGPCWIWQRHIKKNGYGDYAMGGRGLLAHRVSYQCFIGEPTTERPLVLHKCDIPACCNPDHLYAGSYSDNMQDKVKRNRQSRAQGENNGASKLTAEDIIEMKATYAKGGATYKEISTRFNVAEATIERAINGRSWKSVK